MDLKVNIIKEDVFILLEDVVVESLVYKITVKKFEEKLSVILPRFSRFKIL